MLTTNRDENSKIKLGKSEDIPQILSLEDLKKRQVGYQESGKLDNNLKIPVRGTVEAKLPDIPPEPLEAQEKFLDQQISMQNKENVKKKLEQTGKPLGMIDFITTNKKQGAGIGSILMLVIRYFIGC